MYTKGDEGRIVANGTIFFKQEKREIVNTFNYLGLTLTGISYPLKQQWRYTVTIASIGFLIYKVETLGPSDGEESRGTGKYKSNLSKDASNLKVHPITPGEPAKGALVIEELQKRHLLSFAYHLCIKTAPRKGTVKRKAIWSELYSTELAYIDWDLRHLIAHIDI